MVGNALGDSALSTVVVPISFDLCVSCIDRSVKQLATYGVSTAMWILPASPFCHRKGDAVCKGLLSAAADCILMDSNDSIARRYVARSLHSQIVCIDICVRKANRVRNRLRSAWCENSVVKRTLKQMSQDMVCKSTSWGRVNVCLAISVE